MRSGPSRKSQCLQLETDSFSICHLSFFIFHLSFAATLDNDK